MAMGKNSRKAAGLPWLLPQAEVLPCSWQLSDCCGLEVGPGNNSPETATRNEQNRPFKKGPKKCLRLPGHQDVPVFYGFFEIEIFLQTNRPSKRAQNERISFLKASIFSREMLVLTYDLYFFPQIPDWDLWDW